MAPWKFKTRAAGFIALAVLLAACQGSATTTSPTPTSSPAADDDATTDTDSDESTATPADNDKDYYYDPALEGQEINVVLYEGPGTMHLRPYIPQFEEETGINVNLIEIAEDNIIEQEVIDFTTQAGSYDVVQTTQDGAGVAYFASAGWLEDLTPYLDKTPAAFNYDDFAPAIQAATSWPYGGVPKIDEARPYAMMQELTTRIFVYRESLFNDPDEQAAFQEAHGRELTVPTTTDELLEVAEFFTRPDENLYGISFEGARDLHLYAVWIHFLWAFDGREWDPATYEVELDSPEAKAATEFYIELSQYAPPGFNAASIAEAVEAFAQGQSAMSIIWGPTHGWAQGEDESLGAAGYAEIPGAKQYLVAGVGMGINTFSKTQEKKDASWSFISFAESPRIQEEMQRDGNAGPRISVYSNEEVTAEKPAETLSTKLASEKGHPWAMAGGVGTQFVQVVYTNLNRAIAGEATVDDALADAQAEATELFEDAGLGG